MSDDNRRLIIKLILAAIAMFGFSYLLVPLYTLVCKQAGINGRSNFATTTAPSSQAIDLSRLIDVQFTTTIHGKLSFIFKPLTRHLKIHPGESKLVYFYAENKGNAITVQAIPSITPNPTARFLKKTECFCFTQQYFFAGEKAKMPVYFFIDPELPSEYRDVTLSYTLFDATEFTKKGPHYTKGRIELNEPSQ